MNDAATAQPSVKVFDACLDGISLPIDDVAYADAAELGGRVMHPLVAESIRSLALITSATSVVAVSSAPGVAGCAAWLGMAGEGVVTIIADDPHLVDAGKTALARAGARSSHCRAITADARDVMKKFADNSYDVVILDQERLDLDHVIEDGLRLLRPRGVIVVVGEVSAVTQWSRSAEAERTSSSGAAPHFSVTHLPISTGVSIITALL